MIALDASALLDLLLQRPGARATLAAIGDRRSLQAPHLAETELLNALRRWVRRGWISEDRAAEVLDDLAALPLVLHPHSPLRPRVWALRHRLSAYDATYLALAEALPATLVTADRGLADMAAPTVSVVLAT